MNAGEVFTFGMAAAELGIQPEAVGPIALGLDIIPKVVPHNGKAKGLDRDDMAKMRRFLKKPIAIPA